MRLKEYWKKKLILLYAQFRRFRKGFRNSFQDVEVELYDLNKVIEPYIHYVNLGLVIFAIISIIAAEGFELTEPYRSWNRYLDFAILFGFFMTYMIRLIFTSKRWRLIKSRTFESLLILFLLFLGVVIILGGFHVILFLENLFGVNELIPLFVLLTKFYLIMLVLIKILRAAPILLSLRRKPAQVIIFSFISVIIFGAFLLMTPSATTTGQGLSLIDAIFTSTSAVCVTGLIVVDTATHLTMFGQLVVLTLIQIGGLGILTVATLFALYISSNLGVGQMTMVKGAIGETKTHETFQTLKKIVGITLLIEAIGVAGYYISWGGMFEDNSVRLYFSVFHAVSAFCNAGFSVFSNSLADQTNALNYGVNITTMVMIITGGLGFTTLWELIRGNPERKINNWKLSIHTRLVLVATGTLIALGFFTFLVLEWHGVLQGYGTADKILISMFQSVTTRTAGFNSADIGNLSISTTLVFLLLMFIGASPASTAGGIKTTTISVLILTVKNAIIGNDRVEYAGRTISRKTVITALTVFILAITFLCLFTFLLTITEDHDFMDLLFEEISAFATVGLSRGITPMLSDAGKIIISLSMFIGRIGILTLALAFSKSKKSTKYRYPSESVIVA